jgi:hypothetical protein
MKLRTIVICAWLLLWSNSVLAQLGSVPYVYSPGQVILSAEMNANLAVPYANALNRTAGIMTGTLTAKDIAAVADALYDLGASGVRFKAGYFSGVVTAAGGFVGPITGLTGGSTGQIPRWGAKSLAWSTSTFADTYAQGTLLYAGTANVVAGLTVGSSGQLLTNNGTIPGWSTATYPGVATSTGTILYANGTNWIASTVTWPNALTQGDMLVATGANATGVVAAAAAGKVLRAGGASTVPAWSTATYPDVATTTGTILRANGTNWVGTTTTWPTTTTASQILYSSSASVIGEITTGNSGVLVTNGTGVPSIAVDIPTAVTIGGAYVYRVSGTDVALLDGGTAASLSASHGAVVYSTASAMALTGVGASGQIFQSAGAASPVWSTATYPATAVSAGTILRADGTNWAATTTTWPTTTTINRILYSSNTSVIGEITTANGSVLVTNGSGVPSWSTTITWAQLNKTGSSLADLATRAVANLSDGSNVALLNAANTFSAKQTITQSTHAVTGLVINNPDTTTTDFGTQATVELWVGGNDIGGLKALAHDLGGITGPALYLTTTGNYPLVFGVNSSPTPSMVLSTAGVLTVSGVGTHSFSAGGAGANTISVVNTTAGAGNASGFALGNDVGAGQAVIKYRSSTAWTSGPYVASGMEIESSGAGGLGILASHATGDIRFYAGGTTLALTIDHHLTASFTGIVDILANQLRANLGGKAGSANVMSEANYLYIATSSSKYKTNIKPWDVDWRGLLAIPAVTYDDPEGSFHGKPGLILEDVIRAGYPELIVNDEKGEPQNLETMGMLAGMLALLREQDQRIATLEGKVIVR